MLVLDGVTASKKHDVCCFLFVNDVYQSCSKVVLSQYISCYCTTEKCINLFYTKCKKAVWSMKTVTTCILYSINVTSGVGGTASGAGSN